MNIFDVLINLHSFENPNNYFQMNWDKLVDKSEYKGTRFLAFLSVVVLIVFYLFFILLIGYFIYSFFLK
jgi:hypothetical protein